MSVKEWYKDQRKIKVFTLASGVRMPFEDRLAYSVLAYSRRGLSQRKLAVKTGLERSKTIPKVLDRLTRLSLVECQDHRFQAKEPPSGLFCVDPARKVEHWRDRLNYFLMAMPSEKCPLTIRQAAVFFVMHSRNSVHSPSLLAKWLGFTRRGVIYMAWQTEVADIESQLHRLLSDNAKGAANASITAVQQRLSADAALVDFIRCPVRDFKENNWKEAHYFAFVLAAGNKSPRIIDLGAAKGIDALVDRLRQQFIDFQQKLGDCETKPERVALEVSEEAAYRKVATELYAVLFAPLQPSLGNSSVIHLVPDGELNRLPFEALVDSNGKYLVESYRFTYLSNGRDLLRTPSETRNGTLVFANPDFRATADERRSQAAELLPKSKQVVQNYQLDPQVRSIGWKSIPGALLEAKDIHDLLTSTSFGPVKSYTGNQALEEVFKGSAAPRILHIATHGFFLDFEPESPSSDGVGAGWARRQLKRVGNPLLRSGIILAGANNVGDAALTADVDDGWLTAEEIALLDLHGTELVVLSACQTGLGDVKSGEGVYGLRRAFLHAGVRTVMSSLFEVPDAETRDLMRRFYSGMKNGQGKLQALHNAHCEMIHERRAANRAAHPFFWASFVLIGDPN